MRCLKYSIPILLPLLVAFADIRSADIWDLQHLRTRYQQPTTRWPRPTIDSGVEWEELASVPYDSTFYEEQQHPMAVLGKLLFFDPRLSGSNQVSCSSCHDPQRAWSDARDVAIGNDHLLGNRNSISILNVGKRKQLFWDGRAGSLAEQAIGPLLAHHEMAADTNTLATKIQAITGYMSYFQEAFGDPHVNTDRLVEALVAFQKTIRTRRSRFDEFVDGDYAKLNDQELLGLHLFRTKARCMNCHYGPYFSDDKFHNVGLTYYKRTYEDLGRYHVTRVATDIGRFQTPMLRDVMHTFPWMHNGLFDDIRGVISMYNSGMHMIDPSAEEKELDPLFPETDPLMKALHLTVAEVDAIAAFLESISATSYKMDRPTLPK